MLTCVSAHTQVSVDAHANVSYTASTCSSVLGVQLPRAGSRVPGCGGRLGVGRSTRGSGSRSGVWGRKWHPQFGGGIPQGGGPGGKACCRGKGLTWVSAAHRSGGTHVCEYVPEQARYPFWASVLVSGMALSLSPAPHFSILNAGRERTPSSHMANTSSYGRGTELREGGGLTLATQPGRAARDGSRVLVASPCSPLHARLASRLPGPPPSVLWGLGPLAGWEGVGTQTDYD